MPLLGGLPGAREQPGLALPRPRVKLISIARMNALRGVESLNLLGSSIPAHVALHIESSATKLQHQQYEVIRPREGDTVSGSAGIHIANIRCGPPNYLR